MALISEEKRLITGTADSELRVWDISYIQEEVRYSLGNPPVLPIHLLVFGLKWV